MVLELRRHDLVELAVPILVELLERRLRNEDQAIMSSPIASRSSAGDDDEGRRVVVALSAGRPQLAIEDAVASPSKDRSASASVTTDEASHERASVAPASLRRSGVTDPGDVRDASGQLALAQTVGRPNALGCFLARVDVSLYEFGWSSAS